MADTGHSAGMLTPLAADNRRATVRYRCAPATLGHVASTTDKMYQRGWVTDLSVSGIGLLLPRAVPVDTVVTVHMQSGEALSRREFAARVAHATRQLQGDWHVGCELLAPLDAETLELLLT